MKRVAITGGLASGKTTVLWEFARLGFPTLDCDAVVHRLYFEPEVQKKVMEKFGTIDKKEISQLVFASPEERKWLEDVLHPLVWAEIEKWWKSFARAPPLSVVEVPLLYEAGWHMRFDAVVFVRSPIADRVKRGMAKGLSEQQVRARIDAQWSDEQKEQAASFIIDNSGDIPHVRQQVIQTVKALA